MMLNISMSLLFGSPGIGGSVLQCWLWQPTGRPSGYVHVHVYDEEFGERYKVGRDIVAQVSPCTEKGRW